MRQEHLDRSRRIAERPRLAELCRFIDAVVALSADPQPDNVERYLVASRALEDSHSRRTPRPSRAAYERTHMDDGLHILYTAEATAVGGRKGHARTSDGRVDVALDVPR